MRITNKMLTDNFIKNLSKNLGRMDKYHNQLSSGKEVSKPSDNPMLVSKIMSLRNNVMQNEQYNTNIRDTIGWVETQDTALGDLTGTLNRIRDLIIYGSNGALSETDRNAIKNEVEVEVDGIVDVLNTNFDGRYIFAGQKTMSKPFENVDGMIKYNGNDKNIEREISSGVTTELMTNGGEITGKGTASPDELGEFLDSVIQALAEGNTDDLSGKLLGEIDDHIDNVIRLRTGVGATHNRLLASEERNKAENLNLNKLLSDREDIDIAEKYMEYSVMAVVYQASLSVGAKILQPSLMDYLR